MLMMPVRVAHRANDRTIEEELLRMAADAADLHNDYTHCEEQLAANDDDARTGAASDVTSSQLLLMMLRVVLVHRMKTRPS